MTFTNVAIYQTMFCGRPAVVGRSRFSHTLFLTLLATYAKNSSPFVRSGPLAQLAEHRTLNPQVEGSIPSRPTIPFLYILHYPAAQVQKQLQRTNGIILTADIRKKTRNRQRCRAQRHIAPASSLGRELARAMWLERREGVRVAVIRQSADTR